MSKIIVCGDFRAKDCSKVHVHPKLQELVSGADYAICNFEAPIKSDGAKIPKSGPALFQDETSPHFLKAVGFNVFLLANNHIMDYGKTGCQKTIDAFNDCICIGAGNAREAYRVKFIEAKGKTIGFLSLVQHEFGCVESVNEMGGFGTAWIKSLDVRDVILDAKAKTDYLIVFPHAGVEHIDAPLPEWRSLYKRFVDWGADAIIASHPHVPQGWEIYKGKHIFYSLGNFYFDELTGGEYWYKSIAVEVCISDTLEYKIYNLVFDTDGNVSIDDSVEAQKHINYLNQLIADDQVYLDYINTICKKKFEGVKYHVLRGLSGFTFGFRFRYAMRLLLLMFLGKKNEMDLLNVFQNESHRWLAERYLRLKNEII